MSTITEAELIRGALDARLLDLHTMLPGVIETYDAAKQVATVRPVCKRVFLDPDTGERVEDALPVLPNVKVQWPAGGKITGLGRRFFIHFPLDPGDGGILIFSEASFEHWRLSGGILAPEDLRRHSLAAPVFLPGVAPDGASLATPGGGASDKMVFGQEGTGERFGVDPAGFLELGNSPDDFVALASKVDTLISDLKAAIIAWSPMPNDGGAALKIALTNWLAAPTETGSGVVKVKS